MFNRLSFIVYSLFFFIIISFNIAFTQQLPQEDLKSTTCNFEASAEKRASAYSLLKPISQFFKSGESVGSIETLKQISTHLSTNGSLSSHLKDSLLTVIDSLQGAISSDYKNPYLHFIAGRLYELIGNQEKANNEYGIVSSLVNESFADSWFIYWDFVELSIQSNEIEKIISTIEEFINRSGTNRYPELAYSAFIRGMQKSNDDPSIAEKYFEWAELLCEDCSQVYFANAKLQPKYSSIWFENISRGYEYTLSNFEQKMTFIINTLIYVLITIYIFVLLFTFILGVKYFPVIYHIIMESIPKISYKNLKLIISIMLSVLPIIWILLWKIPPMWIILYFIFISWIVCSYKEKALLFISMVLLCSMPIIVQKISPIAEQISINSYYNLISKAQISSYNSKIYDKLVSLSNQPQYSSDSDLHFSLGFLLERCGKPLSAISEYSKVTKPPEIKSASLNNIGNIYYRTGKYDNAIESYKNAINIDSNSRIAFVNLKDAYFKKSLATGLNENEQKHFKEVESKADLFIAVPEEEASHPDGGIDRIINPAYLYNKASANLKQNRELASALWGEELTGVLFEYITYILPSIILVFLIISQIIKNANKISFCKNCGRIICKKCAGGEYCGDCFKVHSLKDSPRKKFQIEKLFNQYQKSKLIFAIPLILLPGGIYIYKNKVIRGYILLLFTSIALALLLTQNYTLFHIPTFEYISRVSFNGISYILLGILYLISIYSIHNLSLKKK